MLSTHTSGEFLVENNGDLPQEVWQLLAAGWEDSNSCKSDSHDEHKWGEHYLREWWTNILSNDM